VKIQFAHISTSYSKAKFFLLFFLLFSTLSGFSQLEEYKIKAALMIKIIPYFNWDEESAARNSFDIAIVGDDPFGDVFREAYLNKNFRVKGRDLNVYRIDSIDLQKLPDLIFIAESEKEGLPGILFKLKGKPVLLVGDTKGYGENGCHVNFFTVDNKIRFELNEESLNSNGITVDYRLRSIAKNIKTKE
jgi:hypothetical protein